MGIFSTLFDENERNVRKLKKIADKVEELSERFKAMSDEELQAITPALKERYNNGEKLDALLPEAFAAVREASTRVTGLRHYYVQLLGGITLHQGRIAEMKTGEGKTLVETLPAYLNALTGNGVHVVTVNDYLAKRDAEWMGKIYRFLGMSVGVILHDMKTEDKKAAYNADITYGTNNEFGFDYLRDNMAVTKEDRVQRGHAFAIVDEVDSILIDEARTPLIISGRGDKSSDMYIRANRFARTLKEGEDYTHEEKEKTVNLTDEGVAKAEKFFGVQNLTDLDNTALNHYINQAMKANVIMKKGRRLHRAGRTGAYRRRIHRSRYDGTSFQRRAASGNRSERKRKGTKRKPHSCDDYPSKLLPPLQKTVGYDGYGEDGRRRIPEHLQP